MMQPYLLTLDAVRKESQRLWNHILTGASAYWSYDESRLAPLVDKLVQEIRTNYPDLEVPYHSRWRHYEILETDPLRFISELFIDFPQEEARLQKARALFEIAIISVLLDAGAGDLWSYKDPDSGKKLNRSEGLAFASLELYRRGFLGQKGAKFPTVDPMSLESLSFDMFAQTFQISASNPLMGDRQRFNLLKSLEQVMLSQREIFERSGELRLGHFFDFILEKSTSFLLRADCLVEHLLVIFGSIWPGRLQEGGFSLGDTWHDGLGRLVPFHKLTQWLAYSLWEPLEDYGIKLEAKASMTALAEYRNGGLLIDEGLLKSKDSALLHSLPEASAPLVVEWRAATIVLVDLLAEKVRQELKRDLEAFPLAKVLQGGTWSLGRKVAYAKRPGGGSPLALKADGTVF